MLPPWVCWGGGHVGGQLQRRAVEAAAGQRLAELGARHWMAPFRCCGTNLGAKADKADVRQHAGRDDDVLHRAHEARCEAVRAGDDALREDADPERGVQMQSHVQGLRQEAVETQETEKGNKQRRTDVLSQL